jgi:integrase
MKPSLHLIAGHNEDRAELEQQLRDHHRVIEAYLDTHVTRNHQDGTRLNEARFLKRWFNSHQREGRPLFVWEAMEPIKGRERIVAYAKKMLAEIHLSSNTVGSHLGILRRLFSYVLAWPYIPDTNGVSIQARYGPVEQPVLHYDYPAHVWGGRREDAPLVRSELHKLYDVLRARIPQARKQAVAARNYTMVVIAGESGLRIREICRLDVVRDLLFEKNRLQTRYGKASRGSGPRVRQTIFTAFAQATVRHFMDHVRSGFHCWSHQPLLFLTERGGPLTVGAAQQALCIMSDVARKKGLRIPPRFGWHSLRRSFATIYAEEHPGCDHTLMEMLGHENPSTLYRYIHHTRNYHEKVMSGIISGLLTAGEEP